jgi:hypothetical protein
MSGIKYVVTTELFWDTLEDYRRHGNYMMLRDKIDDTIRRKAIDRHYRTSRDKPFEPTSRLRDIWHIRLSQEFDVVMFYTVEGDDMTLAMLGNHGDYPNGGRGASKEGPLARRIWKAVQSGHVVSPMWKTLRWSHPSDILKSRDLHEMDPRELERLRGELTTEVETMARFERATALKHDDPENFDRVMGYWNTVEEAETALVIAAKRAELSFERHVAHLPVKDMWWATPEAEACSGPSFGPR